MKMLVPFIGLILLTATTNAEPTIETIIDTLESLLESVPDMPEEKRYDQHKAAYKIDTATELLRTVVGRDQRENALLEGLRRIFNLIHTLHNHQGCDSESLMDKSNKSRALAREFPNLESIMLTFNMMQLSKCISIQRETRIDGCPDRFGRVMSLLDRREMEDSKQVRGTFGYRDYTGGLELLYSILSRQRFESWQEFRESVEEAYWIDLVEPCAVEEYKSHYLQLYYEDFMADDPPVGDYEPIRSAPVFANATDRINSWKICKLAKQMTVYAVHIYHMRFLEESQRLEMLSIFWSTNNPLLSTYPDGFNEFAAVVRPKNGSPSMVQLNRAMELSERFRPAPNLRNLAKAAFTADFVELVKDLMMKFRSETLPAVDTLGDLDRLIWFIQGGIKNKARRSMLEVPSERGEFCEGLKRYLNYQCDFMNNSMIARICRRYIVGEGKTMECKFKSSMTAVCEKLATRDRANVVNDLESLSKMNGDLLAQEVGFKGLRWIRRLQACLLILHEPIDFNQMAKMVGTRGS